MTYAKKNGNKGKVEVEEKIWHLQGKILPLLLALLSIVIILGKWTFGLKSISDCPADIKELKTEVKSNDSLLMYHDFRLGVAESKANIIETRLYTIDEKLNIIIGRLTKNGK